MKNNQAGFTLMEILIVLAIFGLAISGIYQSFVAQNKSYTIQEQLAEIQQNLRAGFYMLEREIRMAGYDPSGKAQGDITEWAAGAMTFEVYNDGTDTFDTIRYTTSGGDLRRNFNGGGLQQVVENVDALDFVYLNLAGGVALSADDIRTVEVTMVVRAAKQDIDYTDSAVYQNQQGTTILDLSGTPDNFRRRMLTARIKCRNLALN
jgi:type IV pilus assembly protein PilW